MNTQSQQIDATTEASTNVVLSSELPNSVDALKELSSIELAYVGGGNAVFIFS